MKLTRPLFQNESIEDMVLNYDTRRTRAEEFSETDQRNLKIALREFCKEKKTEYKQGMNEILAPFMLLVKQGFPFDQAYRCFTQFVDRVIPNVFTDLVRPNQATSFLSGLFQIITLLTKYLLPEIQSLFEAHCISPDFFMTSWIVAVFSTKINNFLQVFYLWEEIIRFKHKYFICILCVAILDIHKEPLLQQEIGTLLVYLSSISLDNPNDLDQLIIRSYELVRSLPHSIMMWLTAFDMTDSNLTKKLEALDSVHVFQVIPSDFFQVIYPENFLTCGSRMICFVLIDVRAEADQLSGSFPNSAQFRLEDLENFEKVERFVNGFNGVKNFSHFTVMGEKEIARGDKEFALVKCFIEKGFCFVSVAKGGFIEAHKLAEKKGLKLRGHRTDSCKGCCVGKRSNRKLSDYLWKGKKKRENSLCLDREVNYEEFNSWIN